MPMSSYVHETIQPSGEGNAKIAEEIRQRVLERLPLFLHNRDSKPMAFELAWFQEPRNFVVRSIAYLIDPTIIAKASYLQVKAVKSLTVRDTLRLGSENIMEARAAGAGATRTGGGPVMLYIAAPLEYNGDWIEYVACDLYVTSQPHSLQSCTFNMPGVVRASHWK